MNEDVFPIEHGDFPMSFVSFRGDKMGRRGVQKISVRWFERKGAVNGANGGIQNP